MHAHLSGQFSWKEEANIQYGILMNLAWKVTDCWIDSDSKYYPINI